MATTYIPLYTTTLASAASSVTFNSISQAYTDLVLVSSMMGDAGTIDTRLTFNGDTSTNYSAVRLFGDGTSPTSNRSNNRAFIDINYGGSVTTTVPTTSIIQIMNYANTTTYKTTLMRSADLGGTYQATNAIIGMWRGSTGSATQAITSMTITGTGNFKAGSTFSLYGVASASVGAKATGGDIIGNDGTYYYHVFNSSGTFTPLQSLTTDVLVLAGGGGGGGAVNGSLGGGGGAGGYQYFTGQSVTATGYSITVGAGGAGGNSSPSSGLNGSNSVFGALTASVGGGGGGSGHGSSTGGSGSNGGSGGGAGFSASTTTIAGLGTAGQGNSGGPEGVGGGGSGGGGAGGAGSNPTAGSGLANSIAGSSITYAIGGSGSGAAGSGVTPSNPIANRGIGGDAGWNAAGGNGGSGLVIVRYPI